MRPAAVGSAIGSIFGLIFVFANSAALPPTLTVVVRVLALAAVVAVVVIAVRHRDRPWPPPAGENGFGRKYWLIVAAEIVAIFGGLALLNGPLDASDAAVGWIAFVVGVHFFALAAAWRRAFFRWLGAALVLCGGGAMVLAAAARGWARSISPAASSRARRCPVTSTLHDRVIAFRPRAVTSAWLPDWRRCRRREPIPGGSG